MRQIYTVLFLILHLLSYSQTVDHSFIVEDNNVIWRKVFEDNPNTKKFTMLNPLKDSIISSHEITNITINYKPYGMNWTNLPTYANGKFYFKYIVEIKEGKYRITVQNMFWRAPDIFNNNRDYDYVFTKILGKSQQKYYRALNQYLTDYFTIGRENQEW